MSRKDNEITDLPVSKIIRQITSKPWDRNDIRVVNCLIVLAIAFVSSLIIKGHFIDQKTTRERRNVDRAIPNYREETQPQNRDNLPENTGNEAVNTEDPRMQQLRNEMENFEETLLKWVANSETAIKTLQTLAEELNVHFSRIRKTKIGGSAAGIVGGVLGIVGLALTPVTFGASLGLSIAGGVVAGLGGATVGGSFIADNVLSKKTKTNAEVELAKYSSGIKYIKERCLELGQKLKDIGTLEKKFPEWVRFWMLFAHGQASDISKLNWTTTEELINTSITNVESAARFVGGGVGAGIRITGAALRVTGTSLHVPSGIIGALMIPFDIYTLVDSAFDVHKKNKHKTSKLIIDISEAIAGEIPKKENIEEMINCTKSNIQA
ncbi:uncharacterized protein LOC127707338 [Mytilus californianus]|uniref:uncharacterized protein LOC127707338 n=1 Tax=Mytilus californianus TaxID=6549 RepID=UPI0022452EFF|nr:uncharacterized protein LOC127707338 [Mytilus californianus]